MITALLIVALAQAPDAPLAVENPDGSVLFSREGYANLSREVNDLQLRTHRAEQRVADLESAPRLETPLLITIVTTCIAAGLIAGWKLKEITR